MEKPETVIDNADSPISVLEGKEGSANEPGIDTEELEEPVIIDEDLQAEEKKLEEERAAKEKSDIRAADIAPKMDDVKFSKLEELLNQTQLYSEFLLERMDDITKKSAEIVKSQAEEEPEANPGRSGRKRKATATSNSSNKKLKASIKAMISTKVEEGAENNDNLTDDQRAWKEQSELVPLLTGGRLKSYQIKGVKWMISLWQNGLNGILADQMGLGKTVQTIGLLAHLKGMGLNGPYLVVAPLSTLSNWVSEITRFVPTMNALLYHGPKEDRRELMRKHMPRTVGPDFPVIVTSYEVAMNDIKQFSVYNWKYLVVDEGHRLKNCDCKLLRMLKMLPVENKLLLTGTPLQNNLAELWSLLNFILPQVFGSKKEFESWFDLSGKAGNDMKQEEIEEKRRIQVISKLHSILRPFLLRRLKEDVEQSLPKKKEIILYANMTEYQKKIQELLINKSLEAYLHENLGNGKGLKAKLNNLMIQLRKNCNHPDLLESQFDNSFQYPPVEKMVQQCGKLGLLDRLIKYLKANKHKILVFSQWTKILDILEYYLIERGYDICRIDGAVKLEERRQQIADFNDTDSDSYIFLLSTRAGGLGINLTAADTVVIYDSDWNPQMDLQAMDRCHRIGQTKPVHVYRLATAHSIEGRMLKVASGKLKLEHLVIEKGQFRQERTSNTALLEADLINLLKQERSEEEEQYECEISDENLMRLLDRSDMIDEDSKKNIKQELEDSKMNIKSELGDSKIDIKQELSDSKLNIKMEPEDSKLNIIKSEPLPLKGPGWEVVVRTGQSGVLSSIS